MHYEINSLMNSENFIKMDNFPDFLKKNYLFIYLFRNNDLLQYERSVVAIVLV